MNVAPGNLQLFQTNIASQLHLVEPTLLASFHFLPECQLFHLKTNTQTNIHTYEQTDIQTHINKDTYKHTNKHTNTYIHINKDTYKQTHKQTYIHTNKQKNKPAYLQLAKLAITYTVVPPYLLVHYSQFQLSTFYCSPDRERKKKGN
jgi:hypothetical protein